MTDQTDDRSRNRDVRERRRAREAERRHPQRHDEDGEQNGRQDAVAESEIVRGADARRQLNQRNRGQPEPNAPRIATRDVPRVRRNPRTGGVQHVRTEAGLQDRDEGTSGSTTDPVFERQRETEVA